MLHHGDCIDVMAAMEPESVDAIVTDPPYGLEFMGKEWDRLDAGLPQENVWKGRRGKGGSNIGTDDSKPQSRHHVGYGGGQQGFKRCTTCGKRAFSGSPCVCPEPTYVIEYNAGPPSSSVRMQRWHQQWAEAAYRVAKPSAYLLAFGGTRTVHRMTVALEDAGWIIRDMLVWGYASGFPKSKASLKPAWEPIVMARKPGPLRMLNIDECRIPTDGEVIEPVFAGRKGGVDGKYGDSGDYWSKVSPAGRWPANIVLSDPILEDDYSRFFLVPDGRSGTLSGTMGTCHTCGAPIAETPSTARTPGLATAPSSADTLPLGPFDQGASDAANPSPSPVTATAPRRAATRPGGTPDSTATGPTSHEPNASATSTSAIETSTSPEPRPGTTSQSDQPARTAERPPTSTATTTTTPGLVTCERCADDATHGRTLPQPKLIGREPQRGEGDYRRILIYPKADSSDREPVLKGTLASDATRTPMAGRGQPGLRCRTCGRWKASGNPCRCAEPDFEQVPFERRQRENTHPTVKPLDLMRHLVRLVTPAGGTVLDPFLGSGTTALAAEMEGFAWIGIEREAEYVAIAEARLNGTQRGLGLDIA